MPGQSPATRLYLVTPPAFAPAAFASALAAALDAGNVAALRVRMPGVAADELARAVAAILTVAQPRGVAVIADTEPNLAREWGCDGVHVAPAGIAAARATAGAGLSVGAGCGDSYSAGLEAAEADADYVWFCAEGLGRESVAGWAAEIVVPCVIGGGITATNAADWAATGAEFLAVGRAVWDAAEGPAEALRTLAAALVR